MTSYLPIIGACCLIFATSFAQPVSVPTAWDYMRDKRDRNIDEDNAAPKYASYDFASLCLRDQSGRLGYIGKDYQRFYIYFSAILKDSSNPYLYHVVGKSKVKTNTCDFTGTMQLVWVRRAHEPDVCENDVRPAVQGVSYFTYELNEDSKQKYSGYFRGTAIILWYLDRKQRLCYDNTWNCADSFDNNCFVGTWTSYATNSSKPCNWGDARIPYSGKLDCGAGEFHPADKFLKFGWDTYGAHDTLAWWK
jgi:hypothetical protein